MISFARAPFLLYLVLLPFALASGTVLAKDETLIDIKDAIAIVSAALGIKIEMEGEINGQIQLDLDYASPRQIRDQIQKALKEQGFYWVSEGGIVKITKKKPTNHMFPKHLPLSYYIEIINRNNLFAPLALSQPGTKQELQLRGLFTFGEKAKAIIEEINSGRSYYVSIGDNVGSLKVINIDHEKVILSNPNTTLVLKFHTK